MKRSHPSGEIPDLEGAIQDYLHDGSDLSIEEGIEEKVFRREVQWTNDDLDLVMVKVLAEWIPIKESIVRSYVDSEEFRVWLDNQAIKKAGPRESPQKKPKTQVKMDDNLENKKAAFGSAFNGNHERRSSNSGNHEGTFSRSAKGVSAKNSEMAYEIMRAGYRQLCRKYHPDLGGQGCRPETLSDFG